MNVVNNLVLAAGGLLMLTFTTIAKERDPPAVAFVQKEVAVGKPESVFVGYVYQLPKKINFGLYTHLCHAFVVADADGKIRPGKTCPSQQLVADAHKTSRVRRSADRNPRPRAIGEILAKRRMSLSVRSSAKLRNSAGCSAG